MRLYRRSFAVLLVVALLCPIFWVACVKNKKLSLNIPEGYATNTLKEFARQTNAEIVFDLQTVHGIKTNAIAGKYYPVSALRMMLEDTPLDVDFESGTGTYAVYRKES